MTKKLASVNEVIQFRVLGEKVAPLISLESLKNVPFEVRRVYYIFGTSPGVKRGRHAHKRLKQVLICVSGTCKILLDNGKEKQEHELSRPDIGLYLDGLVWREMWNFSPDCVLLVLANGYYDESDYIRDYQEFKRFLEKQDET